MMVKIPLAVKPNQTLIILLKNQTCSINVRQRSTGLFLNLYVDNIAIVTGALCLNATKIVRDPYLGFIGELSFFDTQGETDPDYTGFNGRYFLGYIT